MTTLTTRSTKSRPADLPSRGRQEIPVWHLSLGAPVRRRQTSNTGIDSYKDRLRTTADRPFNPIPPNFPAREIQTRIQSP
jgi:hypothetical protein